MAVEANALPRKSSASLSGVESSGSRLKRSFSPTKLSKAMTSETVVGKKPTIMSMNGKSCSAMIGAP